LKKFPDVYYPEVIRLPRHPDTNSNSCIRLFILPAALDTRQRKMSTSRLSTCPFVLINSALLQNTSAAVPSTLH
jgi:hypothetical protein